jgi:predicted naringenin-chalcone synthase
VLRNYGNMSSPTVLFVLRETMDQLTASDDGEHILSFAFGPGLTLESMVLRIQSN